MYIFCRVNGRQKRYEQCFGISWTLEEFFDDIEINDRLLKEQNKKSNLIKKAELKTQEWKHSQSNEMTKHNKTASTVGHLEIYNRFSGLELFDVGG